MRTDWRTRSSTWSWVALAWGLAGCGPPNAPSDEGHLLDGVVTVEVGPTESLPLLRWRTGDPVFEVGGADPRDTHQFVEISDAVRQSNGVVVIADRRAGLVRRYDPSGGFLDQIGSPGDGPGEFRVPSQLFVAGGDTILVWDQASWRTTSYDASGHLTSLSTFDPSDPEQFPLSQMWPVQASLGPGGPDLLRLSAKAMTKGTGTSRESARAEAGFGWLAMESSGPVLIATLPNEDRVTVDAPWGPTELTPPLAARPMSALGHEGGRACVGHSRNASVLCVDQGGERTGVRWSRADRRVVESDPRIERWQAETTSDYGEKIDTETVRELLARVPIPTTYPAFDLLVMDHEDNLWVGLGPSADGALYQDLMVLGPGLGVLGLLTLPALDITEIGKDYVLGIRTDPLGTQTVVVLPLLRR